MEGDIKSYFDTIDHHSLVNILRRRIKDEAFIELIWKFLNAGYMENWEYNATFSGIAQGSLCQYPHNDPFTMHLYGNDTAAAVARHVGTSNWRLPIYHYDDYEHWEVM